MMRVTKHVLTVGFMLVTACIFNPAYASENFNLRSLSNYVVDLARMSAELPKDHGYQEIIELRTTTSKTFQNSENPQKHRFEGGQAPIHFKNPDSGLYEEVDFQPKKISSTDFEGWEVLRNGWHLRLGKDIQRNEDGWVGFGGLYGENWFKYRLSGIGWYDQNEAQWQDLLGPPEFNRNDLHFQTRDRYISTTKESIVSDLEINWKRLWPVLSDGEIFVRWLASPNGLKEDVIIEASARQEILKLAEANQQSGLTSENQFGFIFEVDMDDIPQIYQDNLQLEIENNTFIDGRSLAFRDDEDKLIAFLPVEDLIVKDNGVELHRQRLNNYFFYNGGRLNLFVGISYEDLQKLPPGDLIFDPTLNLQVNAGANDSMQDRSGANYLIQANVHVRATPSDYRIGAFRFQVTGPASGNTIDDAWFEGYFEHASRDDIHADVFAEAVDNASAFGGDANHLSNRMTTRTTADYEWLSTGTGIGWYDSGTGSLTDIIQEIVDRVGWSSGNYIALFFDPSNYDTNQFTWITAYEGTPANAAKLIIEYSASSGSPTVNQGSYRWRDDSAGLNADSGWLAAESNPITSLEKGSNTRLRFEINNTGAATASNYQYRLEYASRTGETCGDETFIAVPATATSEHFEMVNTSQYVDGDSITSSMLSGTGSWTDGEAIEYPNNISDTHSLTAGSYSEFEYAIKANSNAVNEETYCFRVSNDGSDLDSYGVYAEAEIAANSSPAAPQNPFVNDNSAQSGQASPVSGISDETPAFSAIYDDPDTSDTATHYQIQVGTNTDWSSAEKWDSTQTSMTSCSEGSRCSDIIYAGSSLSAGTTYYWRIRFWDDGGLAGAWSETLQFTMNHQPSVTNVVLNESSNIALTSNTVTPVSWTATITDGDGFVDIQTITGKIYRSGLAGGAACSQNDTNCYADPMCSVSGCAGSSCTVTCGADVEFFADPTDSTSQHPNEDWRAWVGVTDHQGVSSSAESGVGLVDVLSLVALEVDSSITYGSMLTGEDTGSTNEITMVINVGNIEIDTEVSGSDMCTDFPDCEEPPSALITKNTPMIHLPIPPEEVP